MVCWRSFRMFELIENSTRVHTRSENLGVDKLNHEESMLEVGLLSTFNAILQQCSEQIYEASDVHTRTHARTHARTQGRTHARTHAETQGRTDARTHGRTDTRTPHRHMEPRTNGHTYTQTHRPTDARTQGRTNPQTPWTIRHTDIRTHRHNNLIGY